MDRLNEVLTPALVGRARVRIQGPYAASDDSQPEPDVALYPPGDYGDAHPSQALLLIEVSRSSLRKDRYVKRDLYAEVGEPEYWIVNLVERVLEVYRSPDRGVYTQTLTLKPGEQVAPEAFPEVVLEVTRLLP